MITKLEKWFPTQELLNATSVIYPQLALERGYIFKAHGNLTSTTTIGGYFAIRISSQNNKERSFQKPTVVNHNSSQTLKLLRYHNIRTCTIASPSQLRNLIQSQNFPIVTASIHCLRLTLHQKLFATHPSLQRLSVSIQKSIGFRYKI